MPTLRRTYDQGLQTSRDRVMLEPGELQTAQSIEYHPGDPDRAHKILGRTAFGDTTSTVKVKAVRLCQFDSGGTDQLLAYSGDTIYNSASLSGTFAALIATLNSSATELGSAHADDRWYLANGYDRMRVVESDGTARLAGLDPPAGKITAAVASGTVGVTSYISTTETGSWPAGKDRMTLDTAAQTGTQTLSWATATPNVTAGKVVQFQWALTDIQWTVEDDIVLGIGAEPGKKFNVTVTISYSTNAGSNYTTYATYKKLKQAMTEPMEEQIAIDTADSQDIRVRIAMTYVKGKAPVTVIAQSGTIVDGAAIANFTTTTGFYYAISEFNATENLDGPVGPASALVTLAAQNKVTLTLPATKTNTAATHYKIWRTSDGGTVPSQLGFIDSVPSSVTTFVDYFTKWGPTTQPSPLVPMVTFVAENAGTQRYPRDAPPPEMVQLNYYRGSLVGTSRNFPRSLFYSFPGLAESWPAPYAIHNFPLPEHDELLATMTIGENLVVGAKGVMLTMNGLPAAARNPFDAVRATPIKGQPGLVGRRALTSWSVAGESRGAWVSPFGVHITDGFTADRISDDLAWSSAVNVASLSTAVLHWDPDRQVLIFAYDSDGGGTNDRFYLIHMAPEHRKANGRPKWTGPHYGSITDLTSGLVSSAYKLYSAHVSDGKVYTENTGTTDASNAYDGSGTIPLDVKGGRLTDPNRRKIDVIRGNLRHTSFGSGQTATVTITTGFDDSGNTQAVAKTVSLNGQQGTEFWVARGGEWVEERIQHTGSASGALLDGRMEINVAGKTGTVLTP